MHKVETFYLYISDDTNLSLPLYRSWYGWLDSPKILKEYSTLLTECFKGIRNTSKCILDKTTNKEYATIELYLEDKN